MSLVFSDTTNYKGIVQLYEEEIGVERGFISGNTERLKSFTARVNLAVDDFLDLLIYNSGTWKPSDSNHPSFDEMTTDLESGRRDYSFLVDGEGNVVLDVYRLYAKTSPTGPYHLLTPRDPDTEPDTNGFTDGQNTGGVPNSYDKQANLFILNPVPNYDATDGLKASISREALYFTHTDTTKKPGFYGLYHKYFFLKPAEDYATRNNLSNLPVIRAQIIALEDKIRTKAAKRSRDERPIFSVRQDNMK